LSSKKIPTIISKTEILKNELIKEIKGGTDFTTIITQSKKIISFGNNEFGQIGIKTDLNNYFIDINIYLETESIKVKKIKTIAAGYNFKLILFENGNLLTLGTDAKVAKTFQKKIKKIFSNYYNYLVITDDYHVFTWGSNSFGK
jgi:alpha-tubulin suppressor-like RCC1 family protein